MDRQWYVLRSKPNKEVILGRELASRGLEYFCPQLHVNPVNPRSCKIRPYFPGYLFVHSDIEEVGVSAFQWIPFSCGLLTFGSTPAAVPHNIIQGIRRHVDLINEAEAERTAGIQRGEPVLIQGGPFEGYEAVFDARLPGSERVRVLLKLLYDRHVPLDLPSTLVRRPQKKRR